MSVSKEKRPKWNLDSGEIGKKRTRFGPIPEGHSLQCPLWSFAKLERNGPFGWDIVKKELWFNILVKLRHFESMTWGEILGEDHHRIPIGDLTKRARERLELLGLDDFEDVISFHFNGKSRIVAIPIQGFCMLLWWDPSHHVCASKKRNT